MLMMCNLLYFATKWIDAERHQALLLDLAVQAKGRRQACALQVGETAPFENELRRATRKRNPQHANDPSLVKTGSVLEIYDLFTIRSQPRQHRLLFAANQELRRILARCL